MSVDVKICGLMEPTGLKAALNAKASFVGFVFHKGSRHYMTPEQVAPLAQMVPSHIIRTGLFVDANDEEILNILQHAPLDLLQLHGNETPERVAAIRTLTSLPVMVALRISTAEHLKPLAAYEAVADRFLGDARVGEAPTGGTGKSFDWNLLKAQHFTKPWMLAGGLKAANLAEAVKTSGARIVDVSSGVEDASGQKSPAKIREFIELASHL